MSLLKSMALEDKDEARQEREAARRRVEGNGGAGPSQSTETGQRSRLARSTGINQKPGPSRSTGLQPREAQSAQNVQVRKEDNPRQAGQANLPPKRNQGGDRSQTILSGSMSSEPGISRPPAEKAHDVGITGAKTPKRGQSTGGPREFNPFLQSEADTIPTSTPIRSGRLTSGRTGDTKRSEPQKSVVEAQQERKTFIPTPNVKPTWETGRDMSSSSSPSPSPPRAGARGSPRPLRRGAC